MARPLRGAGAQIFVWTKWLGSGLHPRTNGIRLVGPNCLGVVNANKDIPMNATFAPGMPPGGDVAFMSQSGALGLSVLDYASEPGIGISQFVSLGNKPDVSVSSAIAVFVAPLGVHQEDVAEAVVQAAASVPSKPVLAVLMGRQGLPQGRAELRPARIPAYIFPESAARALATLVEYRYRLCSAGLGRV